MGAQRDVHGRQAADSGEGRKAYRGRTRGGDAPGGVLRCAGRRRHGRSGGDDQHTVPQALPEFGAGSTQAAQALLVVRLRESRVQPKPRCDVGGECIPVATHPRAIVAPRFIPAHRLENIFPPIQILRRHLHARHRGRSRGRRRRQRLATPSDNSNQPAAEPVHRFRDIGLHRRIEAGSHCEIHGLRRIRDGDAVIVRHQGIDRPNKDLRIARQQAHGVE